MGFEKISEIRAKYTDEYGVVFTNAGSGLGYQNLTEAEIKILKQRHKGYKYTLQAYGESAGKIFDSTWSQYTYEEIIEMENTGVLIPDEVLEWAHSMQDSDPVAYEIDESSAVSEEGDNQELSIDDILKLRAEAKEHLKGSEEKTQKMDEDLTQFNPLSNKIQAVTSSAEVSRQQSLNTIQKLADDWKTLESKVKKGEELTGTEQKRFDEISALFQKEKEKYSIDMSEAGKEFEDFAKSLAELDKSTKSMNEYGIETTDIGTQLANCFENNKINFGMPQNHMASGFIGFLINIGQAKKLAESAINIGNTSQNYSNDIQLTVNNVASILDISTTLAISPEMSNGNPEKIYKDTEEDIIREEKALQGESSSKTSHADTAPAKIAAEETTKEQPEPEIVAVDKSNPIATLEKAGKEVEQNNKTENVENSTEESVEFQKKDTEKAAEDKLKDEIKETKKAEAEGKDSEKLTQETEKDTEHADKLGKNAKKQSKDIQKDDKKLQKEIKQAEKEFKETEKQINEFIADTEAALIEIEQLTMEAEAAQAESENNQQTQTNGSSTNSFTMSPGAQSPQNSAVSSKVPAVQAPQNPAGGAAVQDIQARMQEVGARVNNNTGQITVLQRKASKSADTLVKKIEKQQKKADKVKKESDNSKKTTEKIMKALTITDYVMTATKITGTVVMGVGAGQVTSGTIQIAIGTPMLSNPCTAAAGAALVATGTTLTTTGEATITTGNIVKMVGTYGGLACKAGKTVVAAVNGDLAGALINAAAAAMSCAGGLPVASDATAAVEAAQAAGAQIAQEATGQIANIAMDESGKLVAETSLDLVKDEAAAAIYTESMNTVIAESTKSAAGSAIGALASKEVLMDLGSLALGAASEVMSKKSVDSEDNKKKVNFGDWQASKEARAVMDKNKKYRRVAGIGNAARQNSGGSGNQRRG